VERMPAYRNKLGHTLKSCHRRIIYDRVQSIKLKDLHQQVKFICRKEEEEEEKT